MDEARDLVMGGEGWLGRDWGIWGGGALPV